ncbi:hypothetical protein IMZ48_30630 [Candidatus Bathyarchaeota archaeon]|nr:hypothetical protein [Candidatus Bathyarchaeota archaeon]
MPSDTAGPHPNPAAPQEWGIEERTLNLVCYRPSGEGCVTHQILVARPAQLTAATRTASIRETNGDGGGEAADKAEALSFQEALRIARNEGRRPLSTDEELLREIRDSYDNKLRGPGRRFFSLKSLRSVRLRSYLEGDTRGVVRSVIVEMDPIATQEFLYYIRHPENVMKDRYLHERVWVDWVFSLREEQEDGRIHRHLVEFVEGWSPVRITLAASFPLVGSVVLGVVWSSMTGDAQTAFTVASFVLTFGSGTFGAPPLSPLCTVISTQTC